MNVLDELRKKVLGDDDASDEAMALCNRMLDWLDALDAAHPGLIDKTLNCANCGLPLPNYYEDGSGGEINNPGWNYVWTFDGPKWLEPFEVDDEELHDIWLCCPACAKEATP